MLRLLHHLAGSRTVRVQVRGCSRPQDLRPCAPVQDKRYCSHGRCTTLGFYPLTFIVQGLEIHNAVELSGVRIHDGGRLGSEKSIQFRGSLYSDFRTHFCIKTPPWQREAPGATTKSL